MPSRGVEIATQKERTLNNETAHRNTDTKLRVEMKSPQISTLEVNQVDVQKSKNDLESHSHKGMFP